MFYGFNDDPLNCSDYYQFSFDNGPDICLCPECFKNKILIHLGIANICSYIPSAACFVSVFQSDNDDALLYRSRDVCFCVDNYANSSLFNIKYNHMEII